MFSCARPLVLAPHADDESLGCGGLLARLPSAMIVLVSNGDVALHHGTGEVRRVTAAERVAEFRAAAGRLGADTLALGLPTRGLSRVGPELVAAVETAIAGHGPDCVLVPGRSYHDDHVAVHRAAFAALRPGHCPTVRTVLCYETPYYVWSADEDRFEPNLYVPLTAAEAEAKLSLCALYRSQRLDGPAARSAILGHLQRRGLESAQPLDFAAPPLAEAYRLVRSLLEFPDA